MHTKSETQSKKLLESLALDGIIDWLRSREVHSDALTWTRFGGSLLLVLVVLLFLSGAFMAFYFSPAPGVAYDSIDYALYSVPFGEMIRGVHFYSWNLLLAVLGLHLARTFIFGAYKAPRQLVWISGVMVLLIVPAFIITGDLLPWDQKGYWSTQVRMSIISSVPVVGDFLVRILQGGPKKRYGNHDAILCASHHFFAESPGYSNCHSLSFYRTARGVRPTFRE